MKLKAMTKSQSLTSINDKDGVSVTSYYGITQVTISFFKELIGIKDNNVKGSTKGIS